MAPVDKITKRWIRSELDELAVSQGCRFDERRADHVVFFYERFLRHSKGTQWANQDKFGLIEWQTTDLLMPLMGWVNAASLRRFRQAYVEIPKKNGKTTIGTGLSLYMTRADGEPGAICGLTAFDKQQAGQAFEEACAMVDASAELSADLTISKSAKRIIHHSSRSYLGILTPDSMSSQGFNFHFLLFDELHTQKTRELWAAIRYAFATRTQPLLFSITTSGTDKTTVCYEQHTYAKKVLAGTVPDVTFFAYIRAAAPESDWHSEETWREANPSLGHTFTLESIKLDHDKAARIPAEENDFRRYRLNQWVGQEERWISLDDWDKNTRGKIDRDKLKKLQCWGGLDLSSTADLTSLCLNFPGAIWRLLWWNWTTEEQVEKRLAKGDPTYDLFVKAGLLRVCKGRTIRYEDMVETILEARDIYQIESIGVDPWAATHIINQLEDAGMQIYKMPQGFKHISPPTKYMETLILSEQIEHGGDALARWAFDNMAVEKDAHENVKPSKKKASDRIDPMVAAIMAVGVTMVEIQQGNGPGIYQL